MTVCGPTRCCTRGRQRGRPDRTPTATTSVGRQPTEPRHVRAQDPRAGVPRLPVDRRADRRPLPRARRALHRHPLKWFTFTNGAHIDSLDPATAVRWYDFLTLFVTRRLPVLTPTSGRSRRCCIRRRWGSAGSFPADDPIEDEPDYARRSRRSRPAGDPDPVRQRRRRVAARRSGSGVRAVVPAVPVAGHSRRVLVVGVRRGVARSSGRPGRAQGGHFHLVSARPAADHVHRQHRRRRPVGHVAALPLDAESRGHRALVRDGAARAERRGGRRRSPARLDQGLDARRRPTGDGVGGTPGRRRDVRPERVAARQRAQARRAASTLLEPVLSLRRADVAPLPRGRFTEVTVPLYYEGHVYRAGSRIRITISAPGGDLPRGLSRTWCRRRAARPSARPFAVDAVEGHPARGGGCRGPDRVAAVSRASERAVPAVRAAPKQSAQRGRTVARARARRPPLRSTLSPRRPRRSRRDGRSRPRPRNPPTSASAGRWACRRTRSPPRGRPLAPGTAEPARWPCSRRRR